MKTMFQKMAAGLAAAAMLPLGAAAQDRVEASVGADLVSGYVWRGQELGNASIQPSASVSWKGLSLTAWGSASWDSEYAKEFDLTLGYAVKGFSVSVTDYSFSKGSNFKTGAGISGDYFHFGSNSTLHVFEAQVGYDFGFLAVNWFTNIGGNDGRKADGKRAYSSFVSLSAPFRLGGLDWAATVGATPWETSFYNGGSNGFAVSEVSLQAEKAIRISERFSLPLFAKAIWNPATENAFFTVGVNLSVSNAQ